MYCLLSKLQSDFEVVEGCQVGQQPVTDSAGYGSRNGENEICLRIKKE